MVLNRADINCPNCNHAMTIIVQNIDKQEHVCDECKKGFIVNSIIIVALNEDNDMVKEAIRILKNENLNVYTT